VQHADRLVRDGCLVGGRISGQDRVGFRLSLTGTVAREPQQVEYPGGGVPAGARATSHTQMLNPAIRVRHETMGRPGPNISVCQLVSRG
jgi:hypothetical protein